MDDNDGCPAQCEAGLVEETEHSDEITLKPGHRTNNILKDGSKLIIKSTETEKVFEISPFRQSLLWDYSLECIAVYFCTKYLRFLQSDKISLDYLWSLSALQYTFRGSDSNLRMNRGWKKTEDCALPPVRALRAYSHHVSHTCSKETTKCPAAHKNVQVNQLPSVIWNIVFRETVIHAIVLYLGLDNIEHNVDGRVEAAKHQASDGEYQVVGN